MYLCLPNIIKISQRVLKLWSEQSSSLKFIQGGKLKNEARENTHFIGDTPSYLPNIIKISQRVLKPLSSQIFVCLKTDGQNVLTINIPLEKGANPTSPL